MSKDFDEHCNTKCKYFNKTATEEHGVCSLPESFIPVETGDDCKFISSINALEMTCGKDCARFGSFDCLTIPEDHPIYSTGFRFDGQPYYSLCMGYIDKLKENFNSICYQLYKRGCSIERVIEEWLDEYEEAAVDPRNQIKEDEEEKAANENS